MTDLRDIFFNTLRYVMGPIAGAVVGYCLRCWQKRYKKPRFVSIDNAGKYHLFHASEARAQIRIHNLNDYPITICNFHAKSSDGNCDMSVNYSKGTEIIRSKNPMMINSRDI